MCYSWLFGLVVTRCSTPGTVSMEWVTIRGYTIISHPGLLSLAIPPWVSAMSTGKQAS